MTPNTEGIAAMRAGLPEDARPHFDRFVGFALQNDFDQTPELKASYRLTQTPSDRRAIRLRAFSREAGNVGIHAEVHIAGEYGLLATR